MAKVTPIPVQDFRYDLAAIVRRAEAGERIAVTFHGKAVAALVPVSDLEKVAGKVDLPKRPKPGPQVALRGTLCRARSRRPVTHRHRVPKQVPR